ncbi:hypothetical protein QQS21_004475 [Conoideocrella luteorostrata]|uniref:Copper acquisition factor BIM1-like domain-containing protein n=1 Tax=Conoideocrella luteorostrata TaxID=1105319 RepID=A0AAJ0CRG2_9HYPO|nr:hypothetical protein QQS21_004475 [Conoideocrella luteorostrata]
MKTLTLLSALCGASSAHFHLKYPSPIGDGSTTNEDKAPCGGATPDLSDSKKLVDFHIGGEALAMTLTHPEGKWLFRATTDEKAESDWEQIFPIVQQSGIGDFCEPDITLPSKYSGKKGVVGIVSSATDGMLYQCVAVNFVDGKGDKPSACKNASIQVDFASDPKLSALVGKGGSSTSPSGTGSKTSAGAASTSTGAASSLQAWSTTGAGWGTALAALCMATLGGALIV